MPPTIPTKPEIKQRASQTDPSATFPESPDTAHIASRVARAPKPKVPASPPKDYTKDDWLDDVVKPEGAKKADGLQKAWKVQVDGKPTWYRVLDVKDNKIPAEQKGGGNMYTLEGHPEKTVHQSRVTDLDEDDEKEASLDKAIKPASQPLDYSKFQRPVDNNAGFVKPIHNPIQHSVASPKVTIPTVARPKGSVTMYSQIADKTKKTEGGDGEGPDERPFKVHVYHSDGTKLTTHDVKGEGVAKFLAGDIERMGYKTKLIAADAPQPPKVKEVKKSMDVLDRLDDLIKSLEESTEKVDAEQSNRRRGVASVIANRAIEGKPSIARMPWETIENRASVPSKDEKKTPHLPKVSVRHQGEEEHTEIKHPLSQKPATNYASQAENVRHQSILDASRQEYRRRLSNEKTRKTSTSGAIPADNSVEPTVKAEEKLQKPPVSEAQRRLVHARANVGEAWAKEWAEADKGGKLPEKKESKKMHKCETVSCDLSSVDRTILIKSLFTEGEITMMLTAMADEGSIHRNSALEWLNWKSISPEVVTALDQE